MASTPAGCVQIGLAGQLVLVEPKTEKARRRIVMPEVVLSALRVHRSRQLQDRLLAGSRWDNPDGLIFTTKLGTPLDARNVTRVFHRVLEEAELPSIRFHDLRHTAASLLLAQGVDFRTIMETLGHSQIKLTLDTYSHVLPALQEDAAAKLDEILTR